MTNFEPDEGVYLDLESVITLYAEMFGYTYQQALDRLWRRDVLEGALARPKQHAVYAGADIALQAAALAHG